MKIRDLIEKRVKEKGSIKVSDIVNETNFSRVYVHRVINKMVDEEVLKKVGKTQKARYISIDNKEEAPHTIFRYLNNTKKIEEDIVWKEIEDSGFLKGIRSNVASILSYAFTEMLNNAIEHSGAENIKINIEKIGGQISFNVVDNGVGILNNIKNKKGLRNKQEAIQDLLKGKQTTAPEAHSGEGIFFTSKAADKMIIYASGKKIIFNNRIRDIFIKDNPSRKGTRVYFEISECSNKKLENIFKKYTGESFEFSKTEVLIKLYKMRTEYISRSQARRVVVGLDKFKHITLDFDNVKTVGQGFADEIYRVWKNRNPDVKIEYKNANENIELMIKRALVNNE